MKLRGAPYRIRTYDVLIRSQSLYPAEVTARCITYNCIIKNLRQVKIKKNNICGRQVTIKNNPAGAGCNVLAESWGFEPQIGFESYTRLAGEHLQPLGQLSEAALR